MGQHFFLMDQKYMSSPCAVPDCFLSLKKHQFTAQANNSGLSLFLHAQKATVGENDCTKGR